MTTRAKFTCQSITHFTGGNRTVVLTPVNGADENKAFWEATPSGRIELGLATKCQAPFTPGKAYLIDITEVE